MSYKKNIISNFVTQISISAIAFFTSIVVARALGPTNKGNATYLLLVFNLIGEYGHFGITSASTYFQKKTKYSPEEVYDTNFSYLLMILIFICINIIILKSLGVFLSNYSWKFIIVGMFIIMSTFLNSILVNFYTADERLQESNKYVFIMNGFKSVAILILWVLNKLNLFTFMLFQVIPFIISISLLYKNLGIKYKWKLDLLLLKKEFKFGIAIYIATLLIYLNYRMDQIFIRNLIGTKQLGIYSISVSLAELLFLIPGSVGSAVLGRLYNIDGNIDQKKTTLSMTVKYTFYVCLFIGLIGICMTPLIPYVYGERYRLASVPTAILFIGIIFASIGKVSASYFQSEGNPIIHLIITVITFVSNLIFNIILIPKIGINGAAIASTISYIVYGVMYIVFFIYKEGFKLKDFFGINEYDYNLINRLFHR